MKRLVLLAILTVGMATSARADFATGLRSYEAGDYYAAYKEWLPLAESGDPAAQRNLGHLYRLGQGVTKDFVKAAEWYRKSAEQGFARAQANLGNIYLRGQGVPKDPITAAKWFGRAAKQEHSIAQFNLGLMYENGIGLAQDDVAALGWYYRASKFGHRKAAQRLARLVSRGAMPPTDDTVTPTELDKRDRLASAQRGETAQPLYSESGSDRVGAGRADSGGAESGDTGPDKAVGEESDSASPNQPDLTVPKAGKNDQPADPPVEPAVAPVQAREAAEPAELVPPHPIVVAEAATAIQERGAKEREAAPAEGEPKEIADAREAARSEDGVTAAGDDAEPEPTVFATVPPPTFLVREAKQQQALKKEAVTVENGRAKPSAAPHEEVDNPINPATKNPDIESKTLAPKTLESKTAESETLAPAPPLGVALDAGLSAYQAHDYEAAFRHWLPPAENGNSNAQFFVGGLYRDGAGVPDDPVRAFHWWSLAAVQGHRQADRLLAELKSEMLPEEIAAARKLGE